jgi:hypothetical protein
MKARAARAGRPSMRTTTIIRFITLALAAVAVAAPVPATAQAAPQLTTGWSHDWANSWTSRNSFVSSTGWIDVWTICTPISNRTRTQLIEIKSDSPFIRQLVVACDRRGHWVRRVRVPTGTVLWTMTWPDPDLGFGRTSVYGYGSKI